MIERRFVAWGALIAVLCIGEALAGAVRISSAKTAAEADLVDIRTLVPDIAVDLRYAGTNNFVGRRIDGYAAERCLLRRAAAHALAAAEQSLRKRHLRLTLFDCYRPARAVRQFVEWAGDLEDQATKSRYYPNVDKRALLGVYIAAVSGHSRGATVDLTLQQCSDDDTHCTPLDMGTEFDFFDPRANTDSAEITPQQHRNRKLLRDAMEQAGFRNYAMEWWHFSHQPEPNPEIIHDVPIR